MNIAAHCRSTTTALKRITAGTVPSATSDLFGAGLLLVSTSKQSRPHRPVLPFALRDLTVTYLAPECCYSRSDCLSTTSGRTLSPTPTNENRVRFYDSCHNLAYTPSAV